MKAASLSLVILGMWTAVSSAEEKVLFSDDFAGELSPKWQRVGLTDEDVRLRDGALEIRLRPVQKGQARPMLRVDLPFTSAGTVIAAVDVTLPDKGLPRGAEAGLSLTSAGQSAFTVRKTNIDGFQVFAPGEVRFLGQAGQEGDPGQYSVTYRPARATDGPLRIIVRGHYAYFQTGPTQSGEYRTLFHSAIQEGNERLGFCLFATGDDSEKDRWVRFDNFRVTDPT
jgi:hypothetical protein